MLLKIKLWMRLSKKPVQINKRLNWQTLRNYTVIRNRYRRDSQKRIGNGIQKLGDIPESNGKKNISSD